MAVFFATLGWGLKQMSFDLPVIVPLGGNCFPRWCATMLGFKKRKSEGEPSFPFDAGVFPLAMVRQLVESDFEGMTDPANLLVRRAPGGEPILCDRRFLPGTYNHEMPPATDIDFLSENYRRFVERYERRVQNLRSALRSARRVVLFLTVTNLLEPHEDPFAYVDFESILVSFEQRYPNAEFRLLAIIERFQQRIPDSWDGRIRVFNFQMPGPYHRFTLPYMASIVVGNIVGSVVHSFSGDRAPVASLPDVRTTARLGREIFEAHLMSALVDSPFAALLQSGTPTGNLIRALGQGARTFHPSAHQKIGHQ